MTTGLRCAPLRRPQGLIAISLPVPANSSPVSNSRVDCSGRTRRTALPAPIVQQTADSPPSSSNPVPSSSQPHSTQCPAAAGPAALRLPAAGQDRQRQRAQSPTLPCMIPPSMNTDVAVR